MRPTHIQADQPLEQLFAGLRRAPERDSQLAKRGRAAYLSEVKGLLQEPIYQAGVSQNPFKRLMDWINSFPILMPRKDRSPMFTVLSTVMVVAALMLGGAGATVYASQGSLPDQPLYQVKTLSEEVRLGMSGDPQQQVQLNLSFANRRMEELAAMQQNGQSAPEGLVTRLQLELNQALQISAGMEDAPMQQALSQIRNAIQQMEQVANKLGEPGAAGEGVLAQVRNVLRSQYRLCELGLQEPAQLRLMFKNQNQQNQKPPEAPPTEPPAMGNPGNGAGSTTNPEAGECPECTPVQDGTGPGPGPNAGEGESNGSGGCTDCTPVQDGSGPGPGPNNGPGPSGGSDVEPGSGGCTDCTPAQDGTGPGPGPNEGGNPGSGSDTGSGGSNSGGSTSGSGTNPDSNSGGGSGSGSSGQGGSGKP
jgi:uncharacterized membrane protein YgcG